MIYWNCFLFFLATVVFSAALDVFRDSSMFPARLELFRTVPTVLEQCVPAGIARCGTIPAAPEIYKKNARIYFCRAALYITLIIRLCRDHQP